MITFVEPPDASLIIQHTALHLRQRAILIHCNAQVLSCDAEWDTARKPEELLPSPSDW